LFALKGEMMGQDEGEKPGSRSSKGNLGTFGVVFTPRILTILGIIRFLEMPV
jgi:hypothetical protein